MDTLAPSHATLTDTLSREMLSLPIYPQLPVEAVDRVIVEIRRFGELRQEPCLMG